MISAQCRGFTSWSKIYELKTRRDGKANQNNFYQSQSSDRSRLLIFVKDSCETVTFVELFLSASHSVLISSSDSISGRFPPRFDKHSNRSETRKCRKRRSRIGEARRNRRRWINKSLKLRPLTCISKYRQWINFEESEASVSTCPLRALHNFSQFIETIQRQKIVTKNFSPVINQSTQRLPSKLPRGFEGDDHGLRWGESSICEQLRARPANLGAAVARE